MSYVVIGWPTVQDGLVLRWYRDMADANNNREALKTRRTADAEALVTHRKNNQLAGRIEPIDKGVTP